MQAHPEPSDDRDRDRRDARRDEARPHRRHLPLRVRHVGRTIRALKHLSIDLLLGLR